MGGTRRVPKPLLPVRACGDLAETTPPIQERPPRQAPGKRGRGAGRNPHPPSPGPTTAATPLESRRALRSASERDAKRPPPLIGGTAARAGSGRGRRIQDGGGQEVATVRVDGGQECGGSLRLTASAPGWVGGGPRSPPLGVHTRVAGGVGAIVYLRSSGLHLSAPLLLFIFFHLPPDLLAGLPGGDGADAALPSLYLHSLPLARALPPPRQLSRRREPAPLPGRLRRQSGVTFLPSRTRARMARQAWGSAPAASGPPIGAVTPQSVERGGLDLAVVGRF